MIRNFLRQGGAAPCNHIRIHFDRKGTEILHLCFTRNTHSLMKRKAAPCDHQKLYISVNLDQKGPEIMRI